MHPFLAYRWADLPRLLGFAGVYAVLAKIVLSIALAGGNITTLWLPAGLGLAALLVYGKKYWPGVFAGAFAAGIMVGDSVWLSAAIASGNALESLFGAWLLTRKGQFELSLQQLSDYSRLLLLAGVFSTSVSAIIGVTALLQAGMITGQTYAHDLLLWWVGDMLGVVLLTPMLLVWRQLPEHWKKEGSRLEGVLLLVLTLLFGQIILCGLFSDTLGLYSQAFMLFMFGAWAALRFGRHGVSIVLCILLAQGLYGVLHGVGYFAQDMAQTMLANFWIYYAEFSILSMLLALSQEAWRTSRDRFDLAVQGSRDGIWEWQVQTNEIYLSERCHEMLGYQVGELQSAFAVFEFLLHPDDRDRVFGQVRQHLEQREPYATEMRLRLKSGEYRWFLSRGQAVWNGEGQPTRMAGSMSDITGRRQADQQLRENEERLNFVLEGSGLGYWDWHITTGEVQRNQIWAEMLGYTVEEIASTTQQWADFIHPDDVDKAWKSINDHLEGRTPMHELSYRMRTKDRDYRWVLDHAKVVQRDPDGRPIRMAGTHTDITERMRAEEERQEIALQRELQRKMITVTESRQRSIGQELHDNLGQQLVGISYLATTLEQQLASVDSEAAQQAALIVQYAKDAIVECKSLAQGLVPVELESNGLMAALLALSARTEAVFGVVCRLKCAQEALVYDINQALNLYRMAQEAVTNAIRHGGAQQVIISLSCHDGKLCLSICDNGCGFSGIESDTAENAGMGIRIMRYRASLIGADLQFLSSAEGGTKVLIEIESYGQSLSGIEGRSISLGTRRRHRDYKILKA
ncbi:MAG: PAS domain S-box protein [Nitrosomonadales bacterium]|nr:MAG: PAS domain S-box protein [Nitrosomonadales bacterium]